MKRTREPLSFRVAYIPRPICFTAQASLRDCSAIIATRKPRASNIRGSITRLFGILRITEVSMHQMARKRAGSVSFISLENDATAITAGTRGSEER